MTKNEHSPDMYIYIYIYSKYTSVLYVAIICSEEYLSHDASPAAVKELE